MITFQKRNKKDAGHNAMYYEVINLFKRNKRDAEYNKVVSYSVYIHMRCKSRKSFKFSVVRITGKNDLLPECYRL